MILERAESLSRLRREWNELAEHGLGIFATWEWANAWWRNFGAGRRLLLHASRGADGRLEAVFPLYAWRSRGVTVLRFLGHGPGDELGPVHLREETAAAAAGLRAVLDRLDWHVFLGEQFPGAEGWPALLDARLWRHEASPTLRVPQGGWNAYLASRSPSFREQLRRRSRALERAGARIRLCDHASLDGDLDTLFALHRARWGQRPSAFTDIPFHREVARAAMARDWLRLWLLELDGVPVAAWHGFHVGGITNYYQAGRDPAQAKLSAGFVLLAHTLRAAIEEGATEYRFGRGAEAFKYRFTDDDPGLESVVLARGLRARAAVALARTARKMRG